MTPPHQDRERPPDHLTEDEIEWIRENREWLDQQRRAVEREAWLRGRIKVILPWILSVVAALVAAFDWLAKHFALR